MIRASVAIAALTGSMSAALSQESEPPWAAEARALVPQSYVAGYAYDSDSGAKVGYIALYPADANDPKHPASTFGPREVFAVTFDAAGTSVGGAIVERKELNLALPGDAGASDAEYVAYDNESLARAVDLPPGTEPCAISGWSSDADPNGLNVRAEPSTKAKILGTLPPPYALDGENWLTEFSIIGYRDGWFLIEAAEPPGISYSDPDRYPKDHPFPYDGRGWVEASKVGASFAYGGTRPGGLFQAPHADAQWTPANEVREEIKAPLETGGYPKRLFACSGSWALVESDDGLIGWWRGICSNQVTNCS